MSIAEVKRVIQSFVQDGRNDLLTIKGKWGVGKTFFWHKTVAECAREGRISHKNYSYVSLFGIDSLETLRNSIVANEIKSFTIGKNSNQSVSVAISKVKSFAKSVEKLPHVRNYTGGLGSEFAFHFVSDALICFDDLERKSKGLDIKEVLGLASYLKEQKNCKIVFILNDGTLPDDEKAQFSKHNEKVVDIELNFSPSPAEVFDYIFDEKDQLYEAIKHTCGILEIKNARILGRIARSIDYILPHLHKLEQSQIENIIKSLIIFVFSYYEKDNEKVIPLNFLENYASWRIETQSSFRANEITDEMMVWKSILDQIPYAHTDNLDMELISYVRNGYLNSAFFEQLERREKELEKEKSLNGYRDAWDLYNNTFADNENEFLDKLVKEYELNYEFLNIGDLYAVVEILRLFAQNEKADALIDKYIPLKATYEKYQKIKNEHGFEPFKDAYFTDKLESLPKKTEEPRKFANVVKKFFDDDLLISKGDMEFLASRDESEYYDFFKSEVSSYLYPYCKKLLSFRNSGEAGQIMYEKTEKALLKIAEESKINKIRVSKWFKFPGS